MLAALTTFALLTISAAFADEAADPTLAPAGEPTAEPAPREAEPGGFPVVVLGQLVCMPCLLNQQQGASDLCELMNHGHQILVEVAQDRAGNELPAMKGEVVDYRQPFDAHGIVLTEAHHGRRLLLYGAMEADGLHIESVRPVRAPHREKTDFAG